MAGFLVWIYWQHEKSNDFDIKSTHTHLQYNYHPYQKRGIIKTFADRVQTICQSWQISDWMKQPHKAFLEISYYCKEIYRIIHPRCKEFAEYKTDQELLFRCIYIKYLSILEGIWIWIIYDTRTIYKTIRKLPEHLNCAKDKKDFKTSKCVRWNLGSSVKNTEPIGPHFNQLGVQQMQLMLSYVDLINVIF